MGRSVLANLIIARLLPWWSGQDVYSYHGIVPYYCNVGLDWGALPPRPSGAQELAQVQVFVRHGARTQESSDRCWEGDDVGQFACSRSHGDRDGASCPGELAASGYEQEVNNGERLRDAYILREGLLGPSMAEAADDLLVRSTDKERTRQSARAVMSGMFGELSGGALPWVEPEMNHLVQSRNFAEENMVINYGTCPASSWKAAQHFDGLPLQDARDMQTLCKRFRPQEDMTNKECAWWLTHLMDCLMSRVCPTVPFAPHNATVPHEFFDDDDQLLRHVWRILDEVALGYFQEMVSTGAMSSLVGEILETARLAARGLAAPRLLLYSGHDTGPMEPLSVAFGLRDAPPYWPAFASMMVLEVWHSDDGPIARWIIDGHVAAAGAVPFEEFERQAAVIQSYAPRCHDDASKARAAALAPVWFKSGGPLADARAFLFSLSGLVVLSLALLVVKVRRARAKAAGVVSARDCRAVELCSCVDAALPSPLNEQV